ncbi:MAG: hypothetical protein ACK5OB_13930 [Pirellula sp.]
MLGISLVIEWEKTVLRDQVGHSVKQDSGGESLRASSSLLFPTGGAFFAGGSEIRLDSEDFFKILIPKLANTPGMGYTSGVPALQESVTGKKHMRTPHLVTVGFRA